MKKLFSLFLAMLVLCSLCIGITASAYADDIVVIIHGSSDDDGEEGTYTDDDDEADNAPGVVVTKDPTGETVEEGGTALFISRAENYTNIIWLLLSENGTIYENDRAAGVLPGLEIDGIGTDTLILSNIPGEMDGWRVQAEFTGRDGNNAKSAAALITVNQNKLESARITSQPQNVTVAPTQNTTLTVAAVSPDGNTLTYQWYSNTTKSNTGGVPVVGATAASFIPESSSVEGTVYYYAAIWNTDGNRTSEPVYTEAAAITYSAATVPPSPTPGTADHEGSTGTVGQLPAEGQNTAELEPTSGTARPGVESTSGSDLTLLVIGAVLCVTILAAAAALVVLRRNAKRDEEESDIEFDGDDTEV